MPKIDMTEFRKKKCQLEDQLHDLGNRHGYLLKHYMAVIDEKWRPCAPSLTRKGTRYARRYHFAAKYINLEEHLIGEKLESRLEGDGVPRWITHRHFHLNMNIENFVFYKRKRRTCLERNPKLLKSFIRRAKSQTLWISAEATKAWLARNGLEVSISKVYAYRKDLKGTPSNKKA